MLNKVTLLFLTMTLNIAILESTGTYSVEYSHQESEGLSTNGSVTITSDNVVVYQTVAIDAKDFSVESHLDISEEMILTSSEARAWNTETLEEYKIEKVDVLKVNDELYRATIYSFDNINVTININVEKEELDGIVYEESIINSGIRIQSDKTGDNFRLFTNLGVISVTGITILGVIILLLIVIYNLQIKKSITRLNKNITNVKKTQH